MKNILTIIFLLFTFLSYSQTKDYKPAYELTKQLNTQYKLKITSLDSVVSTQDSLHISLLVQQKDFLNKNINLYKKELDRRDKFWNKPAFGIILGVAGTVGLIHVIDYTLP